MALTQQRLHRRSFHRLAVRAMAAAPVTMLGDNHHLAAATEEQLVRQLAAPLLNLGSLDRPLVTQSLVRFLVLA